MTELDLLRVTPADGRELLAAARSDWSRPVPDCPGWDAGDLVGHMGAILGWMARIVATGQAVPRRDRETPPAGPDALAAWYSAHLDQTLGILSAAPATSPVWTFSTRGDHQVSWWRRRLAVELAIHRWDAEHAAGLAGRPVDSNVAAAGIEEYLAEFLPGLLAQPSVEGLTGSLHLHATDSQDEWWVDLDARDDVAATRNHRTAGTAVRATGSDLLLWLTNRKQAAELDIVGTREVAARWTQLRR